MKIEINTESYNERRYGKPYIAKIDFSEPKGIPTWGAWVGQAGAGGLLILENIQPGDIIMRGQRDNRNMKYSAPNFYIVQPEMSLESCTKAEAYLAYHKTKVNAKED